MTVGEVRRSGLPPLTAVQEGMPTVTTSTTGTESPWFRRFHRTAVNPRARLVCFHSAGGNANQFRSWPGLLPLDLDVLAVQPPGRQDRIGEPVVDRMDDLVSLVVAELLPLTDLPLVLFGHSMGAAVAHEVAARLEDEHDVRVPLLLVSGRAGPGRTRPRGLAYADDETLLADVSRLSQLDRALFADPDLREVVLPSIRGDYRLVETYRAPVGRTVEAPIVAYTGAADPVVRVEDVREWATATSSRFEMRVFDGGHSYLVPQEAALVADVRVRIDRALG
ncbi:thioesterase [Actinoalloteichus sp. AHMU CJ021]|nr:thioesterase [Actinoalloteichus sp. AHMU CJ021]